MKRLYIKNEEVISLIFSEAEKRELDEIISLLADDVIGSSREQFTKPIKNSYEKAFKHIQQDPNAKLIVVKLDNQIVGVAQINFITYLTYQGGTRAQIEGVRIHKNYRTKGIGKQLFDYLIALAKNHHCHLVQLTTDKSRLGAFKFYQKLGFVNSHEGFKLHLNNK